MVFLDRVGSCPHCGETVKFVDANATSAGTPHTCGGTWITVTGDNVPKIKPKKENKYDFIKRKMEKNQPKWKMGKK